MTTSPEKQDLSQEQLKDLVDWLLNEMDMLNKEIRVYNDAHDYYLAAQAEGTRDAYLRMYKKITVQLGK